MQLRVLAPVVGGPAELAVDAFFHASEAELRLPETNDPRADFRAQITELNDCLRAPRGRALAAMLGGTRSDPALANTLNVRWREPRRRWGSPEWPERERRVIRARA